jgi:hypothetical protein
MRTAVMIVLLLSLSLVMSPVKALPGAEVDNTYYDDSFNLIGEKDILCSGAHYTWGNTTTAAHRSSYSESCDTGSGGWACYRYDSSCSCYVSDDLAHCGL